MTRLSPSWSTRRRGGPSGRRLARPGRRDGQDPKWPPVPESLPSGSYWTLRYMSFIPGEPPLVHAPSRGDPRLVPWLTHADVPYLSEFEFGPSINLVASDLAGAVRRRTVALRVR